MSASRFCSSLLYGSVGLKKFMANLCHLPSRDCVSLRRSGQACAVRFQSSATKEFAQAFPSRAKIRNAESSCLFSVPKTQGSESLGMGATQGSARVGIVQRSLPIAQVKGVAMKGSFGFPPLTTTPSASSGSSSGFLFAFIFY